MPSLQRRDSLASTYSSHSSISATDRPRPTLADVSVAPRYRLRDGSRSSRGSRASSVASSASSANRGRSAKANALGHAPPHGHNLRNTKRRTHVASEDREESDSDLACSIEGSPAPDYDPPVGSGQLAQPSAHGTDLFSIVERFAEREERPEYNPDGTLRFTSQEKGKGRARVSPIEVQDVDEQESQDGGTSGKKSESESVELILDDRVEQVAGKKRRAADQGFASVLSSVRPSRLGVFDREKSLGEYTCPICFGAPIQAVMTLCGHVLCAQCLLDSLLAAIRRNPEDTYRPPSRGRGRGRGRGGTTRRGRRGQGQYAIDETIPEGVSSSHPRAHPSIGGPDKWQHDTLTQAWVDNLIRVYNRRLERTGVDENSWEAIREADPTAPLFEKVEVTEELSGLWNVDGLVHVVEGECPVCRKRLPGGFGPPGTGIGAVIPLYMPLGNLHK